MDLIRLDFPLALSWCVSASSLGASGRLLSFEKNLFGPRDRERKSLGK